MKPSEVYREAARRIACGVNTHSCIAVFSASGERWALADKYKRLFRPVLKPPSSWGLQWSDDWPHYGMAMGDPEVKQCRVLALCFMAAIAESEES